MALAAANDEEWEKTLNGRRLTRRLSLGGGRAAIRDRSTTHALHLVRRLLLMDAPHGASGSTTGDGGDA